MRVSLDMLVVLWEDLSQEFVFSMMDGLDDEPVISREVEEGAEGRGGGGASLNFWRFLRCCKSSSFNCKSSFFCSCKYCNFRRSL